MKNKINEHLIPKTDAKASESQIILIGNSRITVLKDGLIRIETSKTGQFTDLPTKIVWFRNFPDTAHSAQRTAHNEGLIQNSEFRIQNEGNINNNSTPMPYALCPMPFLKISTGEATFIYNAKAEKITHVELGGRKIAVSNAHNLKGTRRTLDGVAGSAKLNGGVLGKNGVAFFEDNTPLLGEDGLLKARDKSGTDTYIFASQDYVKSVKNFYAITGAPPLVPRYALGNWWSRYYAYTQNEYIELMDKFAKEGYPFSVATIDMDWHYVDIEAEFGKEYGGVSGWTGYSWNKNYFPDYKKFLKDLQDRGLRTSL
ncbi:MAG: hypothetical protein FWD49_07735, partial [Firmicutes bacterium]|nr:hypothetical protein [Bacillota bacterium]